MNIEQQTPAFDSSSMTLDARMMSLLKMTNAFTMKLKQQSMEKSL